jgi:hypothetical protein
VTAGYPDWQSYSSWRGAPIVSNTAFGMGPGGNSAGITPIPHWSGVTLRGVATNRNVVFALNFYADAGGTVLVERVSWCCPVGVSVSVNVPALGPYVEPFVTNLGAAGGAVSWFVQPTNVATAHEAYYTGLTAQPLATINQSILTTGNVQVSAAEIYEGAASLMVCTSAGNSYHGTVQYFDSVTLGGLLLFRFVGSLIGQGGTIPFCIPPAQLIISVVNDDAATRFLTVNVHREV